MPKLSWTTEKRKIADLVPFPDNPRRLTEKQAVDLKKSLAKFDLVEIPAIDKDNKIIAGHQRLKLMVLDGRGEEVIDVRVPNRKLTDAEFLEYNLRSNKNTGEWDFDILANWDEELLKDVGFSAKDIILKPISSSDANRIIKLYHYSHKVVNNSQLHFGVFLNGKCGGAMQFGPSLDKRKMLGLVAGAKWNDFLELNRMAFADWLPRNSESRAISYAIRFIKKTYPHIKWIVSFADGTQCGDGTIYRASGFVLTAVKPNNQIYEAPSGEIFNDTSIRPGIGGERERAKRVFSRTSLTDSRSKQQQQQQAKAIISRTTTTKGNHILDTGASSMKIYKAAGWKAKEGFQLRYIYLIDKTCKLTVPVLPFSEIAKRGATMYKGKRPASIASDASGLQPEEGGSAPTAGLQ
jgi:hypothetical protein